MAEQKGRLCAEASFEERFGRILFLAELVFADTAELAGEIFGQIFPLDASFVLIVDPAAQIANVLHAFSSLGFWGERYTPPVITAILSYTRITTGNCVLGISDMRKIPTCSPI